MLAKALDEELPLRIGERIVDGRSAKIDPCDELQSGTSKLRNEDPNLQDTN
jgi:hypothetical protein